MFIPTDSGMLVPGRDCPGRDRRLSDPRCHDQVREVRGGRESEERVAMMLRRRGVSGGCGGGG
eukprot:564650-Rhodomonas_salina.1